MFHSYFERKNGEVLTFNIAHFPKLEISGNMNVKVFNLMSVVNETSFSV